MSLREWLKSQKKTARWLALRLGVTPQAVSAWIVGHAYPRIPHLLEIERLSQGQVTAKTLRGGDDA